MIYFIVTGVLEQSFSQTLVHNVMTIRKLRLVIRLLRQTNTISKPSHSLALMLVRQRRLSDHVIVQCFVFEKCKHLEC